MALGSFDAKLFDSSTSLDHIKKWLSGDVGTTSLVSKPRLLDIDRLALNNSDTTSGTPLDITSVATTTSIAVLTANSITTGEILKVVTSATGLTGAGRLLLVDATGDFNDTAGIVAEFKTVHTTGVGVLLTMDSITDGFGMDCTFDGLTSGEGLRIVSSSTGLTTNGRVAHFHASGDFNDTGGAVVEIEGAQTTGTGLLLTMDAVTDGLGLFMTIDALTTGIGVSVESGATAITGAGRLLLVNLTAASSTTGIVAEIRSASTDETALVRF